MLLYRITLLPWRSVIFKRWKEKALNLGSISKLMSVGRNTGHAGDAKVKGIKFQSNLFCEHNQESSETRVHMNWKVEAEAERGDLRDRIHDPVRVLGRAHEKRDGVSITSTFHVTDTWSLRDRVHRHVSYVYPYTPFLEHCEKRCTLETHWGLLELETIRKALRTVCLASGPPCRRPRDP